MNGFKKIIFCDNRGQSTIEYLIVTFLFVAALVTAPSIYQTSSDVLKNKYRGYSFGVAISDPPRKAFDDTLRDDVDFLDKVLKALEKIQKWIENPELPEFKEGKIPSWSDVQDLKDRLKKY